jgi:fructokinase
MTVSDRSAELDAQTRAALTRALGRPVRAATWLAGGYSTENWRLDLASGPPLVARRYHPERSMCAVEAALLGRLAGAVPVAEVVLVDSDGRLTGTPLLVTTFVDGVSAAAVVRDGDADDVADVAASAGAALAAIGALRFPAPGFFRDGDLDIDPVEPGIDAAVAWIASTLDRAVTVDPALRAAWQRVVRATAAQVSPMPRPTALTHSDYNPKNLVVGRDARDRWQVRAVLDWEFAYAGDPLADVGNWLRFADRHPASYRDAFLSAYADAGGDLPPDWASRAAVLDAMALADFLAGGPDRAYYADATALVTAAVAAAGRS